MIPASPRNSTCRSPPTGPCVLAAVDDTPASRKAALSAARYAASQGGRVAVVLFHLLPAVSTQQQELGAHGTDELELRRLAEQAHQRRRWIETQTDKRVGPLLSWLAAHARQAGLSDADIETCSIAPSPQDDLVKDILRVARERQCSAIFVGRDAYPWYRELFHRPVGEALTQQIAGGPITVHVIDGE